MKDIAIRLQKLRDYSAEWAMDAGEAAERANRELFLKISRHLATVADDLEAAMTSVVWPD